MSDEELKDFLRGMIGGIQYYSVSDIANMKVADDGEYYARRFVEAEAVDAFIKRLRDLDDIFPGPNSDPDDFKSWRHSFKAALARKR